MTKDKPSTQPASPGYWTIVWLQFRKNPRAMAGLAMTAIFFLVAFFAPFIAHRLPIAWFENGEWSFPLLRAFFAPSPDTSEKALEVAFNYLFIFIPLAMITWFMVGRLKPDLDKKASREVAIFIGATISLVFVGAIFGIFYATNVISIFNAKSLTIPLVVATFVLVGIASMVVIIMTAAMQMTASPRWLPLIVVAALVAIPFVRVKGRMDAKDYYALQHDGKGKGLFPLIHYGPNENEYGPHLPPTWYMDSSWLDVRDITDWPNLADTLLAKNKQNEALAAISSRLPQKIKELLASIKKRKELWNYKEIINPNAFPKALRDKIKASGKSEKFNLPQNLREKIDSFKKERGQRWSNENAMVVEALNKMIGDKAFFEDPAFINLQLEDDAKEFSKKKNDKRSFRETQRINRRIFEAAMPVCIAKGTYERRKKPHHKKGYHLLGTDEVGRDILVRIIHGARVSLSVGFVSTTISTVLGLILGSIAAYYGGRIDFIISRLIEIMMSFPRFFLILTIIAVLDERSILNIMLVIGFTAWTGIARLIRGEVLRQKKLDYVASAKALGATDSRIIFKHILPNAIAPVLVSITFGIASAILSESGLSFLGFGVSPPTPTWGELLAQGRQSPLLYWWLVLFPGILVFLGVFAYNMVGEGLRDAMDPRLKK